MQRFTNHVKDDSKKDKMLYVFDMGNVVIKDIDVLEKIIKLLGIDAEEFLSDYGHYAFPLMDGTVTCDRYYKHLEHVFGIRIEGKPLSDNFSPCFNLPMVEILDELRNRGNRIICASNTYKPHWDKIEKVGFDKVFDRCYLSHEIGLTKPSKAFFEYILKEENVSADNAFFTDDYKENIDAAQKLGFKTFWYYKGFDDSKLRSVFGL